jgi:hypothetical protein
VIALQSHNSGECELEKWQLTRSGGKLNYMLRWIVYMLAFMLFLQGVLVIIAGKQFDVESLAALIVAAILQGISVATIRWHIFERRRTMNKHHND